MTFGRNNLTQQPTWTIESKKLSHVDELQYLGALLKYDSGASHVKKRIQSAQKAYYGLQGAGLCLKGLRPYVAARLYSVGVRTVLMYGCEAINLNKKSQKLLESTQGKLVKAFIGLRKTSYTTPIINALKIPSPSTSVPLSSLELLYVPQYAIHLMPQVFILFYFPLLIILIHWSIDVYNLQMVMILMFLILFSMIHYIILSKNL